MTPAQIEMLVSVFLSVCAAASPRGLAPDPQRPLVPWDWSSPGIPSSTRSTVRPRRLRRPRTLSRVLQASRRRWRHIHVLIRRLLSPCCRQTRLPAGFDEYLPGACRTARQADLCHRLVHCAASRPAVQRPCSHSGGLTVSSITRPTPRYVKTPAVRDGLCHLAGCSLSRAQPFLRSRSSCCSGHARIGNRRRVSRLKQHSEQAAGPGPLAFPPG